MLKTTRKLIPVALLLASVLCGTAALANGNVTIQDQAGVLSANDKQSITQAAQSLPYGVVVWTVNGGFAGNKPGFLNQLHQYVGSNTVGIAVDTGDRFSEVAARQNTGLSPSDAQAAKASANSHFASKDWGGGMVAALGALAQAAPYRSNGGAMAPGGAYAPRPSYSAPRGYYQGAPSSGGFSSIIMLVVVIGILVMLARRFMGGGMTRGFSPYGPGQYGPGYGPGGYGPGGYGPGYSSGGSGLMAGGLGAVGGGLLGYELGKSAGEREAGQFNQPQGGQDFGSAPDPGGFVDSDSGAGSAPDFGGGMDSGGADFGGGGGGSTDF